MQHGESGSSAIVQDDLPREEAAGETEPSVRREASQVQDDVDSSSKVDRKHTRPDDDNIDDRTSKLQRVSKDGDEEPPRTTSLCALLPSPQVQVITASASSSSSSTICRGDFREYVTRQARLTDRQKAPQGHESFVSLRDNSTLVFRDITTFFEHIMEPNQDSTTALFRGHGWGKTTLGTAWLAYLRKKTHLFKGTAVEHRMREKPLIGIHLDISRTRSIPGLLDRFARVIGFGLLDASAHYASAWTSPLPRLDVLETFDLTKLNAGLVQLLDSLEEVVRTSGLKFALFIDGYDFLTINALQKANDEEYSRITEFFTAFYFNLKAAATEGVIPFQFITGSSRLGFWNSANSIIDLSFNPNMATVLGYTWQQIEQSFPTQLTWLEQLHGLTRQQLRSQMEEWYGGYRWSPLSNEHVFNPRGVHMLICNGTFHRSPTEANMHLITSRPLLEKLCRSLESTDEAISIDWEDLGKPRMPEETGEAIGDEAQKALLLGAGILAIHPDSKKIDFIQLKIPNRAAAGALKKHLCSLDAKSKSKGLIANLPARQLWEFYPDQGIRYADNPDLSNDFLSREHEINSFKQHIEERWNTSPNAAKEAVGYFNLSGTGKTTFGRVCLSELQKQIVATQLSSSSSSSSTSTSSSSSASSSSSSSYSPAYSSTVSLVDQSIMNGVNIFINFKNGDGWLEDRFHCEPKIASQWMGLRLFSAGLLGQTLSSFLQTLQENGRPLTREEATRFDTSTVLQKILAAHRAKKKLNSSAPVTVVIHVDEHQILASNLNELSEPPVALSPIQAAEGDPGGACVYHYLFSLFAETDLNARVVLLLTAPLISLPSFEWSKLQVSPLPISFLSPWSVFHHFQELGILPAQATHRILFFRNLVSLGFHAAKYRQLKEQMTTAQASGFLSFEQVFASSSKKWRMLAIELMKEDNSILVELLLKALKNEPVSLDFQLKHKTLGKMMSSGCVPYKSLLENDYRLDFPSYLIGRIATQLQNNQVAGFESLNEVCRFPVAEGEDFEMTLIHMLHFRLMYLIKEFTLANVFGMEGTENKFLKQNLQFAPGNRIHLMAKRITWPDFLKAETTVCRIWRFAACAKGVDIAVVIDSLKLAIQVKRADSPDTHTHIEHLLEMAQRNEIDAFFIASQAKITALQTTPDRTVRAIKSGKQFGNVFRMTPKDLENFGTPALKHIFAAPEQILAMIEVPPYPWPVSDDWRLPSGLTKVSVKNLNSKGVDLKLMEWEIVRAVPTTVQKEILVTPLSWLLDAKPLRKNSPAKTIICPYHSEDALIVAFKTLMLVLVIKFRSSSIVSGLTTHLSIKFNTSPDWIQEETSVPEAVAKRGLGFPLLVIEFARSVIKAPFPVSRPDWSRYFGCALQRLCLAQKNDLLTKIWKHVMLKTEISRPKTLPGTTSATGLQNVGNTCYMNAVLQVLRHIRLFTETFSPLASCLEETTVTVSFLQLVQQYQNNMRANKPTSPEAVWRQFTSKRSDFCSGQHDASEFMLEFLDVIDTEADNAPATSNRPSECFQFLLEVIGFCQECKKIVSTSTAVHYSLELALPTAQSVSMNELLAGFFRPELLQNARCPKCSRMGCYVKISAIKTLPRVLVVTLKRAESRRMRQFAVRPYHLVQKNTTQLADAREVTLLPFCSLASFSNAGTDDSITPQARVEDDVVSPENLDSKQGAAPAEKPGRDAGNHRPRKLLRALSQFEKLEAASKIPLTVPQEIKHPLQHAASSSSSSVCEAEEVDEEDTVAADVDNTESAGLEAMASFESSPEYQLIGMVRHEGNDPNSGHYTAFAKQHSGWTWFNDESVTQLYDEPPTDDALIYIYEQTKTRVQSTLPKVCSECSKKKPVMQVDAQAFCGACGLKMLVSHDQPTCCLCEIELSKGESTLQVGEELWHALCFTTCIRCNLCKDTLLKGFVQIADLHYCAQCISNRSNPAAQPTPPSTVLSLLDAQDSEVSSDEASSPES